MDWRKAAPEREAAVTTVAAVDPIAQLERISAALANATDLDSLFDETFGALRHELGLEHGFLLFTDSAGGRLYNVASQGFAHARFGAEIAMTGRSPRAARQLAPAV